MSVPPTIALEIKKLLNFDNGGNEVGGTAIYKCRVLHKMMQYTSVMNTQWHINSDAMDILYGNSDAMHIEMVAIFV